MAAVGAAVLKGPKAELDKIYVVCSRIRECASVSDKTDSVDWIGHIIKNFDYTYCSPYLRLDGVGWDGDNLKLHLWCYFENECFDSLAAMVNGKDIEIVWEYRDLSGNKRTFNVSYAYKTNYPAWKLFTAKDLDLPQILKLGF